MIYVREDHDNESIYTPLHIIPPTLHGLAQAISEKYPIDETKITAIYKRCLKGGVTVKIDDEMLRHYTNQDTFLIEIKRCADDPTYCTVTLVELNVAIQSNNLYHHISMHPHQQQQNNKLLSLNHDNNN